MRIIALIFAHRNPWYAKSDREHNILFRHFSASLPVCIKFHDGQKQNALKARFFMTYALVLLSEKFFSE